MEYLLSLYYALAFHFQVMGVKNFVAFFVKTVKLAIEKNREKS